MDLTATRLLRRAKDRLSVPARRALRWAVSLAEERGVELYLVGGAVRDLLLDREDGDLDLDVVMEGDAAPLASSLASALGARLVAYRRFGTVVVQGDGFRLDFAQARVERYRRPGALPSVSPATLPDDLARRDFTVNAMALRLCGASAGALIDRFGGREDLRRRRLRVLHDESFRDDATRILRAVRYAGRLGFRLAPRTAKLLRRELVYLDTISGVRLRNELQLIASEACVDAIMRLAGRLGIVSALHPALAVGATERRALRRLPEIASKQRDAVLLAILIANAPPSRAEAAIARLSLSGRQAAAARGCRALLVQEAKLAQPSLRPSQATRLLATQPPAAIEAFRLMAQRRLAAERARRYLEDWRFIRPRLNGRDVEALGVPHGPKVGVALGSLRAARLDGRTESRADEITLVRKIRRGGEPLIEAHRD